MDLIDRKAAIDALYNAQCHLGCMENSFDILISDCVDALECVKAVDAEPMRHGKWVYEFSDWLFVMGMPLKIIKCSLCDKSNNTETEYCPHCGAKMDLEDKNGTDSSR